MSRAREAHAASRRRFGLPPGPPSAPIAKKTQGKPVELRASTVPTLGLMQPVTVEVSP